MDNEAKRISALPRDFQGYVSELRRFARMYYPNIVSDLSDASIGSFLIDLNSSVADNLSNYLDKAYSETQIDQATQRRSLFAIARTKGLRIPGKKASLLEVEISCEIPMDDNQMPDENYYPIIKKGSQGTGGGSTFELLYDVNFSYQFDHNGISNRMITPRRDSNGTLIGYTVTKREIMSASSTKIYKVVISDSMLIPFFEITLPETNVLCVDSIICKEGTNFTNQPSMAEFSILDECVEVDGTKIWKYFEVESLLEDKIFLPQTTTMVPNTFTEVVVTTEHIENKDNIIYNYNVGITRGMWKPLKQKFISEYTDRGFFKITFGPGSLYDIPLDDSTPTQKMMARMVNNTNMGVLPNSGQTMWVMYRIGGGSSSNIANNTINSFSYKNVDIKGKDGGTTTPDANKINAVHKSIRIRNTSSAMGGKDEPSEEEIRYMIKYNNMAQNRCVTIKDYIERVNKMPGLYGTPFRTSIIERNNIIFIYVLGIDHRGHATDMVTTTLMDNMSNYLSEYKVIGDYVIIKPGRVINLQVECDIIINKGYNNNSVVRSVQDSIYDFFDINNHTMGDNIFVSHLIKEIVSIPGVDNLIEVRVYNVYGGVYNTYNINQPVVTGRRDLDGEWVPTVEASNRVQVDLVASDNILYGNADSMFEILSKDTDIRIRVKQM